MAKSAAATKAAVLLGRRGGRKFAERLSKMTPEERSERGRRIAAARWQKPERKAS